MTNDKTGEVLALVSYPGYDNNRIGDGSYFSQLQADLSLPLYNNATQTRKAPGSTFKPITAVAALEEHAITADETINCSGIYTDVEPPIKCWIYSGQHGPLNIVGGIENSCNYFFADLGHRLSTDGNGIYYEAMQQNLDWITNPVWRLVSWIHRFPKKRRNVLPWDREATLIPMSSCQGMLLP